MSIFNNDQYTRAATVTPSDSVALPTLAYGLYVGGAGNVALVTEGGDAVTLTAVPVGSVIRLSINQIKATGTTATNLVAVW